MSSNASNVFFAAVSWSVAQRGGGLRDISKRLEGDYVWVGGILGLYFGNVNLSVSCPTEVPMHMRILYVVESVKLSTPLREQGKMQIFFTFAQKQSLPNNSREKED